MQQVLELQVHRLLRFEVAGRILAGQKAAVNSATQSDREQHGYDGREAHEPNRLVRHEEIRRQTGVQDASPRYHLGEQGFPHENGQAAIKS